MGGNIIYDILSNIEKNLKVDVLVTVGSQVGLFEELGLLGSRNSPRLHNAIRKKPVCPPNIGKWLNVFDPDDILGFSCGGILKDVTDWKYSTGTAFPFTHGHYFLLPSFYQKLAARIKEAGL